MLVEFQRVAVAPQSTPQNYGGEDDGLPAIEPTPLPVAINPLYVASITPHTEQAGIVVIKLADGRGYLVRGTYAEIKEQLEAGGRTTSH